jgi:hypothetical protein
MYIRLARREEREVMAEYGEAYIRYAKSTPAFIPLFGCVRSEVRGRGLGQENLGSERFGGR